jgi:hypothetical protein
MNVPILKAGSFRRTKSSWISHPEQISACGDVKNAFVKEHDDDSPIVFASLSTIVSNYPAVSFLFLFA